jgi:HNH endonuclease
VPISDKNRKILWGKSGNRCAMCRHPLVVDPTELDSECVVGDECHIVSGAKGGLRHDPSFPASEIDELSNLMLLCRIHHKLVDDQAETYTAGLLRSMKANHEEWVEQKLKDQPQVPPVRIRRIRSEIPTQLPVVLSGKELLNLAMGCHGSYPDYSDDLDDEETDLVGGFIQNVSDWADLAEGLEPIERIRAAKSLGEEIKTLKERGVMVFAAIESQRIEGGISGPSTFRVLHLSVKRGSDPGVVTMENESP